MSVSLLTTSSINSLIENFKNLEKNKLIGPLDTRKKRYTGLSTSYETLSTKLSALKNSLSNLKLTGSDSLFAQKAVLSSDPKILTASAGNTAITGSFSARVLQLAKNDVLSSTSFLKDDNVTLEGTHSINVRTGDGDGNSFISTVNVTLGSSETYLSVMEKLRDAINTNKAVVQSTYKNPDSVFSGGTSTFKVNINGADKEITVNGGGTYSELYDEVIARLRENVKGLSAERKVNPDNADESRLELTVSDINKYISITHVSGYDVVADLGIGTEKLKAASGTLSAASFSPVSGSVQFTLTSRESGVDYRIMEMSDVSGGGILNLIGLNIGTSRPEFNQESGASGYLYADISTSANLLNSRLLFNGITVQRNSNTVKDLVSGLTINLLAVSQTADPDTNLSVTADKSAIKGKIEEFITKFNDVYNFIRSKRLPTGQGRGVLFSDTQAATLLSILSQSGYTKVEGLADGELAYLSQIGITFNPATGLTVSDSSLLEQKLNDSTGQVEALFNSGNGVAVNLFSKLEPYLGAEGFLAAGKNTFDSNVRALNDRIDAAQKRIDKSASSLRKQYETLQAQLASLISFQNMFGTGNTFF